MTLATTRRGRTLANRMAQHVARVLASPLKGVYSTHIDSAQQFDRHWHDTYGFGFLEHGAQEWFSGRGIVRGTTPTDSGSWNTARRSGSVAAESCAGTPARSSQPIPVNYMMAGRSARPRGAGAYSMSMWT